MPLIECMGEGIASYAPALPYNKQNVAESIGHGVSVRDRETKKKNREVMQ